MKMQFSPYLSSKHHPACQLNLLSSVLKACRLSGWSVCLCKVLLVGKHLGIIRLHCRYGLLTRRNSSQWDSSLISQNHRIVRLGQDLEEHLVPTSLPYLLIQFSYFQLLFRGNVRDNLHFEGYTVSAQPLLLIPAWDHQKYVVLEAL